MGAWDVACQGCEWTVNSNREEEADDAYRKHLLDVHSEVAKLRAEIAWFKGRYAECGICQGTHNIFDCPHLAEEMTKGQ